MPGSTEKAWRHRAFISYSQADMTAARRLQRWLEAYKLPRRAAKSTSRPRRIGKLFRDETDLSGAADLGDALKTALDTSEALIVLCSPDSAKSEWVNREIQHFRATGRTSQIFAVILRGTPKSGDPETECFPPAFRSIVEDDAAALPIEPLAVNPKEDGRDRAYTRLAAGLFEVPFDDLWRREQRRQRRRMAFAGALTTTGAGLLAAAAVAGWFALKGFADLDRAQSDIVSREAGQQFTREAGDHTTSLLLALQADPAAQQDRIGALFDGGEGYPAARAQMVSSYLSNRMVLKIAGDGKHATSVSFSPDGKTLLYTSTQAGYAKIVDAETGELLHDFKQTTDDFADAQFSPDGKWVANNWKFPGVQIRPADGSAEPRTIMHEDSHDTNQLFAFSSDGSKIAIARQKAVDVFDAETGAQLATIPFHFDQETGRVGTIIALAFSADDRYFVVGQDDGHILCWDILAAPQNIDFRETSPYVHWELTSPFGRPPEPITGMQLRFDPVVPGRIPRLLILAKTASGTEMRRARLKEERSSDSSYALIFRTDSIDLLFSGYEANSIRVSDDLKSRAYINRSEVQVENDAQSTIGLPQLSTSDAAIYSADFSPDGNRLAVGLETGDVIVWDISMPRPLGPEGHEDVLKALAETRETLHEREAVSPDGALTARSVLPGEEDWNKGEFTDTVHIISNETGEVVLELAGHERIPADLAGYNSIYFGWSSQANMMAFSPDGNFLATIARDKQLHLWNLSDGSIARSFSFPKEISSFAISPTGEVLAVHLVGTGSTPNEYGEILLLSMHTGHKLSTLGRMAQEEFGFLPPDIINTNRSMMTFSADSTTLVALLGRDRVKPSGNAYAVPEFLNLSAKEQVELACALLKRAQVPTHFTTNDIITYPSLAGEKQDPETSLIASPCTE